MKSQMMKTPNNMLKYQFLMHLNQVCAKLGSYNVHTNVLIGKSYNRHN
jgi:hypothetical protein